MVPSRFVMEGVCKWLGNEDTSFVQQVGNPVDVEQFSPASDVDSLRSMLKIDRLGPHVSIVAALAPHKGHDCFLKMAGIVLQKFSNATFHVVGSANAGSESHSEHLHQLVRELGIEKAVRFWGFVADDVVQNLLRASDLFVLPTQLEGFGLSIAEAQACGVPVLTSSIGPLNEVVCDGRTGWLIPPQDYEQYAMRALELLSSDELRRRFAYAGRRFIVEHYSHKAFANRVMRLYETL
jgi:glycosyltransferase involved in cell wall biosynthesis